MIGTNLSLSIKEFLFFLLFVPFTLLDFFFFWALLGFFLLSNVNKNKQSFSKMNENVLKILFTYNYKQGIINIRFSELVDILLFICFKAHLSCMNENNKLSFLWKFLVA